MLSGVVSVLLWASIWLVCLNNAAQYRVAVAERPVVAPRPDLEAASPDDAYFL